MHPSDFLRGTRDMLLDQNPEQLARYVQEAHKQGVNGNSPPPPWSPWNTQVLLSSHFLSSCRRASARMAKGTLYLTGLATVAITRLPPASRTKQHLSWQERVRD